MTTVESTRLIEMTSSNLSGIRLSVVVGGAMSDRLRRDVSQQRAPRIDVLEMESRFGARVYDFGYLERRNAARERRRSPLDWLIKRSKLSSPALAYAALEAIKNDDIVYATGEDIGYPLAVLMRAFRIKRPKLVVRIDQPVLGRTQARRLLAGVYIQGALARMEWIGCHSNVQRQYLASIAGVPQSKLGLLVPKVDMQFFTPDGPVDPASSEVVPSEPYMLSAGLEMRDYGTLIEAMKGLPVRLVIAAGSPWSHFRFRHGESLPTNVAVSSYSHIQMRELYRSALFTVVPVRPTLRTCGITAVLESWAMGKGVVASRTVGLLDYGDDGETMLFAQPGDVSDLREKIAYLLEKPGEAERLGQNGSERVNKRLNLDTFMDELQQLFVSSPALQGRYREDPSVL